MEQHNLEVVVKMRIARWKLVVLCVTLNSVLVFGQVSLPYIRSSSTMAAKKPVIVFVHGLFGDADSTWRYSRTVYWPELLTKDSTFNGWDIYVASYPTPYLGNRMSLGEIVSSLNNRLVSDGVFSRHSDVVFICHSLGGLVVQRLLLNYRDYAKQVRFIFFFSTPHTGAEVAKIGHAFSSDPLLETMLPGDKNDDLFELENEWDLAHFAIKRYCTYEKNPYHGVIIVDRLSATRHCDEAPIPINEDHSSIVKPSGSGHASYIALANAFIANNSLPLPIKPARSLVEKVLWKPTGDMVIDSVEKKLNDGGARRYSDGELTDTLRPLFEQPVFMYIGEELPESALYRFCRNSQLMDYYTNTFSKPSIRRESLTVTENLIHLQEIVGGLYGKDFSAQKHCETYGENKSSFIKALPPRIGDRESIRNNASEVLSGMRNTLASSFLIDPTTSRDDSRSSRQESLEEQLGDQYADEKRYDQARSAYEVAACSGDTAVRSKIDQLPNQTIYSLREAAQELQRRSQWKCSEDILQKSILMSAPDPEQDFYLLGNSFKADHKLDSAVAAYAKVDALLPKSTSELKPHFHTWAPYFRQEYGWALQESGQFQAALEQFTKAKEWRPTGDCIPTTLDEVKSGQPTCH